MTDENPLVAWLRQQDRGTGSHDRVSIAGSGTDAEGADDPSEPREAIAGSGHRRRRSGGPATAWSDVAAPAGEGPVLLWDLEEEPPAVRRPRRRLLVLAVAPWLAALALAVAVLAPRDDGAAAEGVDPPSESAEALPAPAPPPRQESPAPAPSIAPRAPADHLGQVAALLVRSALSDGGRYVDAAVPAAVEPVGDAALVTVLALVLERAEEGWEDAHLERYAVALAERGAGPVVLAGPWPLPPSEHPARPAPAIDDPRLAEATARELERHGYRELTRLDLARDPALPGLLVARLDAVAPGGSVSRSWTALLTDGPDPRVLGGEAPEP